MKITKLRNARLEDEYMVERREPIPFFPYAFLEGKRVKLMCWNGKMWVKCDRNGRTI